MQSWKRNFYTLWSGQAFSQITSSVLQFVIVWYLTDHTRSGMVLSLAMLAGFLPQGLLGPFIGVYIDRFNRKHIMIASDLAIAAVSLALLFSARDGALSIELILVVLTLRAVGTAFHHPTINAVTPQLVPARELTRCAGYTQSLQSASLLLSPALAAVLYANFPLWVAILLDVVGALLACALAAATTIPPHTPSGKGEKLRVMQEAKEGFLVLKQNRGMMELALVSGLYTIALMPVSALFPLMTMGHFGKDSIGASLVEIVFALGFMVGAVILGRWGGTKNKVHTIVGSYLIMAITLLISGLLPATGFGWFVVCAWFMGFSGPFYWGMLTPLLQQNFPQQVLGRVLAITGSIRFIAGPLALLISGRLSDSFGEESWFLIAGVLVAIAAGFCLLSPAIRTCDQKKID